MGRWTSYEIKPIITTKVDYQNSCRGIEVPAANIECILHYFEFSFVKTEKLSKDVELLQNEGYSRIAVSLFCQSSPFSQ